MRSSYKIGYSIMTIHSNIYSTNLVCFSQSKFPRTTCMLNWAYRASSCSTIMPWYLINQIVNRGLQKLWWIIVYVFVVVFSLVGGFWGWGGATKYWQLEGKTIVIVKPIVFSFYFSSLDVLCLSGDGDSYIQGLI